MFVRWVNAEFERIASWIGTWDRMAILYAVVGGLIITIMIWWFGALARVYKWVYKKAKFLRGMHRYRTALRKTCSSLIVIGRRQGFSMSEVFINLDLAPSEFSRNPGGRSTPHLSRVIVAGPGAGKSTIVRKMILDGQGHPRDEYRSVYSKVLARLAFDLHKSERSDCSRTEAIVLFEKLLPKYGFQAVEASKILDSIFVKTGVLVRDAPERVIFSHFGLQEYHASLIALDELGEAGLAVVGGASWWREVILLGIAQKTDPDSLLERLFELYPLLAVTATAECPTPSIDYQRRAVECCLREFPKPGGEAAVAAIALARKVHGSEEATLIGQLETRLASAGDDAGRAGMILAKSGTAAATSALTRHPDRWETCLKEVGYLSTSFENMLVESIRDPANQYANRAIDILTSYLSADRRRELVTMLPKISPERADYLARSLLVREESDYAFEFDAKYLLDIASCAAYVKNRTEYLEKSRSVDRGLSRRGIPASCAVFLSLPRAQPNAIYKTLRNGYLWSHRSTALLLWSASTLVAIGSALRRPMYFTVGSVVIAAISLILRPPSPPWRRFADRGKFLPSAAFLMGLVLWSLWFGAGNALQFETTMRALLISSFGYFVLGAIACWNDFMLEDYSFWNSVVVGVSCWAVLVLTSISLDPNHNLVTALSFIAFLGSQAVILWFYRDFRRIRRAITEVQIELEKLYGHDAGHRVADRPMA